jgi:DNA-binding beta-propeller fold protein YncE
VGTEAQFFKPSGLVYDVYNNLGVYVADKGNNMIRFVLAETGAVHRVAGSAIAEAGFADGVGADARFDAPTGVTMDSLGVMYVADGANNRIRRVDISSTGAAAEGTVTTIAGRASPGGEYSDGVGTLAAFDLPFDLVVDATGTKLYVTDYNTAAVRLISISGTPTPVYTTTTFAGLSPSTPGYGRDPWNQDDVGTNAVLHLPTGITLGQSGTLYVAATLGHKIRNIDTATQYVGTLAGAGPDPSAPLVRGNLDG